MISCVGVVGVQGDVPEHERAIRATFGDGVTVRTIRQAGIIPDCDAIVIPGGESTTIGRLLRDTGIDEEIADHATAEKPILATCAGLILCATSVTDDRIASLDLLDISVDRNAYGRQRESFEAPITVAGLDSAFPGVFIRAPRIVETGNVEVIARLGDEPVAVRNGAVVGASFHPELTADSRFHEIVFGVHQ